VFTDAIAGPKAWAFALRCVPSLHFLFSRAVFGLTPALPLVRNVGGPGSGTIVGQPPQFNGPMWLAPAPWSNTTVLVPDAGNGRVVEVDVVNGTLVRVWATSIGQPRGAAATSSVLAVSQENATSSRVLLYSVQSGALLVAIGGAPLAAGSSCCGGLQLGQPSGLRFSQDGSTLDVAEAGSNRVSRWRVADGTFLGTVGSGYARPLDVQQCFNSAVSSSVGIVAASANGSSVDIVVDGVLSSVTGTLDGSPGSVVVVPGLGMLVVLQGSCQLVLLSSVAINAQPGNASVLVGFNTTFAVSTSGATLGVTYVWTLSGSVVGGNSSSYTYNAVPRDAGQVLSVVCVVSHALGWVASSAAFLTVNAQVRNSMMPLGWDPTSRLSHYYWVTLCCAVCEPDNSHSSTRGSWSVLGATGSAGHCGPTSAHHRLDLSSHSRAALRVSR
jgi:hypothetical protein